MMTLQNAITLIKVIQNDLSSPSFLTCLCFSGEWQTRFDPQGTSKGLFYLDNQNSVSVDMMKSAQYPLRLLDDPNLEAQVFTNSTHKQSQWCSCAF